MHAADLGADVQVMQSAQSEANALLAADPELEFAEHRALKAKIEKLFLSSADSFN